MEKISVSILSADFMNLESAIESINASDIEYIHLDVMDGHFVPNLTFGYELISNIKKKTSKKLDTHLMISNPEKYIDHYIDSGSNILSIHQEISSDVIPILEKIRANKVMPGLVFNPDTPIDNIEKYFPYVDQILLMSVFPGFAGQKFIPETLERGKQVRDKINASKYSIDLEIDGGVSEKNIEEIRKAGFNIFVSGSYLFRGNNLSANAALLRKK